MDEKNLLDDVELFVNQKTTPRSSHDSYKSPKSAASSDLRDVFIFNNNDSLTTSLNNYVDKNLVNNVPTDNLLGFTEWQTGGTPPTSAGGGGGSDKFMEDSQNWPELPAVSVENYVRSSRSSSSTTIENRRESLEKLINHVPLLPPRPSSSVKDTTNYRTSTAVPPKINRSTTSKTTISNGKLANGSLSSTNHIVSYGKTTKHNQRNEQQFQNAISTDCFDDVVDDNDNNDDDDDIDEDDVFFSFHDNYETTKPLINAGSSSGGKKKVRFLDGSRVDHAEINVGGNGGDSLIVKRGRTCRYALIRFGYLMIANAVLAAVVCALIYLPPLIKSKRNNAAAAANGRATTIVQCKQITVDYNDNFTFPHYFPTSDIKLYNLTNDKRLCAVFGFGSYTLPCDTRQQSCQRRGGVLAFDLTNGRELWKIFTADEIIGVNCQEDVDGDRVIDCAVGGRSGILKMVSGKNGVIIWEFLAIAGRYREVLTPQWIADATGDGIADLLVTINIDTEDIIEMSLYLLSGKTGQSLSDSASSAITIRSMKSQNSALIWRHGDVALEEIVWASGTLKINGGINLFSLRGLKIGKIEERQILYTNASVISRPIFADLNGDGFKDLLICSLNGDVMAFSGALPHKKIWQYARPQSQCASLLIVGSFENDTCPDVVVTFHVGDGFPNYKYTETILLAGKTGLELERMFSSPLPLISESVALKTTGRGNNLLLAFKFGCTSGLSANLDAAFSTLMAPLNFRELSAVDYCSQLYDSKRTYEILAVRKSFSTSLISSSSSYKMISGNTKLFEKTAQFNDWAGQSGLDADSLLFQIGQIVPVSVADDGASYQLLVPTFWTSALDTFLAPRECFVNQRDYLSNGVYNEKCRNFVDQREKRKKQDNIGIDNPFVAGFTVFNRITLRCRCADLKSTETCSKFLPP